LLDCRIRLKELIGNLIEMVILDRINDDLYFIAYKVVLKSGVVLEGDGKKWKENYVAVWKETA